MRQREPGRSRTGTTARSRKSRTGWRARRNMPDCSSYGSVGKGSARCEAGGSPERTARAADDAPKRLRQEHKAQYWGWMPEPLTRTCGISFMCLQAGCQAIESDSP